MNLKLSLFKNYLNSCKLCLLKFFAIKWNSVQLAGLCLVSFLFYIIIMYFTTFSFLFCRTNLMLVSINESGLRLVNGIKKLDKAKGRESVGST